MTRVDLWDNPQFILETCVDKFHIKCDTFFLILQNYESLSALKSVTDLKIEWIMSKNVYVMTKIALR